MRWTWDITLLGWKKDRLQVDTSYLSLFSSFGGRMERDGNNDVSERSEVTSWNEED